MPKFSRSSSIDFSAQLVLGLVLLLGTTSFAFTYSRQEKDALAKLRPMVESILEADYMNTDQYLIRWLRAKNLNVQAAREMLSAAMEWRKAHNMSTILNEDFTKMKREYPIYHDGYDKQGRPITIYLSGRLDFRKIAIAGGIERLHRYINQIFELAEKRVRDLNNPNVTDTFTLYDLTQFNRKQHLCLQCIGVYVYFTQVYEAYYPQLSYRTMFINMPSIFEQVLVALRPIFSEHTRKSVYFYGHDKNVWRQELQKLVPSNQLYRQFGGTKIAV